MTHQTNVPPGVARSFERGAVDDDMTPEPPRRRSSNTSDIRKWLEANVTVQNFLLLVLLLFQAGGWWQRVQAKTSDLGTSMTSLEVRLTAAELAQKNSDSVFAGTYMRRDVIEERLKSMDARLSNIEIFMARQK